MVSLRRELVSFHRLSIQTTLVSGIVWSQFVMKVLTGGSEPPVWGKGVIVWGRMGSLSMTSYRLPIITIGLSLTVFAVLRMFQTDGQTDRQTDGQIDRIGLAIGGNMH